MLYLGMYCMVALTVSVGSYQGGALIREALIFCWVLVLFIIIPHRQIKDNPGQFGFTINLPDEVIKSGTVNLPIEVTV